MLHVVLLCCSASQSNREQLRVGLKLPPCWTWWISFCPSVQPGESAETTSQQNHEVLAWHPDSAVAPFSLPSFCRLLFPPSLTHHPLLPSLPVSLCPPAPYWLWKMASVSHLGTKIKGKLQPTSMQNVIWKPPSYVLTIDFSLSSCIPSLTLSFLLISSLHFYPSTILRSVKFEEERPPNLFQMKRKKRRGRLWFDSPQLCLFAFRVHFVM